MPTSQEQSIINTYGSQASRRDCFILTCESWMSQGAYIAFPINPTQLNFDIGVRTTNELTRATQLIYVWRFLGNHTTLSKPIIKITANSGNIVPSFNPDVIHECQRLVMERTLSANAYRPRVRDLTVTDRELQREYERLVQTAAANANEYDAALQAYMAARPTFEQTRDYVGVLNEYASIGASTSPNFKLTDSGLSGAGNLPNLYSQENKHVPIGIQNLYALYSLADERRIRRTSEGATTQTENRLMMVLSTPVFPRLTLYGWMGESGITYAESADEPHSFDVNFDFIVTETIPKMGYNSWQDLATTYTENINTQVSTLQHARQMFPNGTRAVTPRGRDANAT